MKNEIIKSQIRFPKSLRDWLKQTAKNNHRSMNSELNLLIERAKEQSKKKTEKA